MSNRDERIRKALEDLRERCAWVAERITSRRRMISALMNNEEMKSCEVAATIRKIDVQQHYECVVREVETLRAEVDALREVLAELITWIPSADTYRRLGFDPAAPMQALKEAKTVLRGEGKQ